ncbi:MAG TPA: ECF transporter S component [Candidatus Paceibacterota bacterium]|nr:ECF transporter S component [Candidatus Paceibacterota bacterium]HPT18224.1 ECF transporter S component [Candidatus Paceibacterota bacterium]
MKSKVKTILIFVGCFLFRLLPFRAPNVEPIMASIMPVGRKNGPLVGFLFGFLSIFLFDCVTNFGSWTWITAITYGLIGAISVFYFKKFKSSPFNFAVFSFFATIVFDFITGILFAPLFGQTMFSAFILQIPFTLLHLSGNIGFALTISPIINYWLTKDSVAKVYNLNLSSKKQVI